MDFIINIATLSLGEKEAFEAAWHKFMSESDGSVQASFNGDEYLLNSYHEASDRFEESLRSFLNSVSPKITTYKIRTVGFEGPRWTHEFGKFVEHYGSF